MQSLNIKNIVLRIMQIANVGSVKVIHVYIAPGTVNIL